MFSSSTPFCAMDRPKLHSWADLHDNMLIQIMDLTIRSTNIHGPTISALRLVCKHWCQAAGRCNIRLNFWNDSRVSRDSQLGTLLASSFSGVSIVSVWGGSTSAEAVDSLGQLPRLTSLSFFKYSGPGITAAYFTRLQSLTLDSTLNMMANWLPASVPHLQGLTEFIIRGPSNIRGEDLSSLSELSSLRALCLEGQSELRHACPTLSCLNLLTQLEISRSILINEFLTGLQALTRLEKLVLSGEHEEENFLTDAIMPTIAGLRRLQHLDLSGSSITDAAMPHIAVLTNLRELGLDLCPYVTKSGLQQLRGLKQLNISNARARELISNGYDDTSDSSSDMGDYAEKFNDLISFLRGARSQ